jgi:hypothetical protein
MVVLLIGRSAAAVAGALLVLAAWSSVIRTLIVPRRASTWVTRWVHPMVIRAFQLATSSITDYGQQDRVLAGQAAAIPPLRPPLGPPPGETRTPPGIQVPTAAR